MKIQKIALAGISVVLALSATSCLEDSENSTTVTKSVTAYNLITPLEGNGDPFVGLSLYKLTVKYPDGTVAVSTESLGLPGGTSCNFATKEMQVTSDGATIDDQYCEVLKFEGLNVTGTGSGVTDLTGQLTQAVYPPGIITFPGSERAVPCSTLHYLSMQYTLSNTWRVRTFWPDATFRGTTVTTYPGMQEPFKSTDIAYRVIMQLKDGVIRDKADIVFYNAKFAPAAPEITVVLKDLDLKFRSDGYSIIGENVIPYMVEAGELQETPRFKFDRISFRVFGQNISDCECHYTVAGSFEGSFDGKSMIVK